jgi:hypothetical protein
LFSLSIRIALPASVVPAFKITFFIYPMFLIYTINITRLFGFCTINMSKLLTI